MKNSTNLRVCLFILTGVLIVLATSCKKDSAPVLTTSPVAYISEQSVTCSGNVTDDGGASVTDKGICWGASHNPTTANDKVSGGSGSGSFNLHH